MTTFRQEELEPGAVLYTSTEDSGNIHLKLTFTADELSDLRETKYAHLVRVVEERLTTEAQAADWLGLPEGSARHAGLEGMLVGFSFKQRQVIDFLRRERRRDPARAASYDIVGLDRNDRPVLQKPAQWGGGTDVWAVLRSGEPTNVMYPVRTLAELLR